MMDPAAEHPEINPQNDQMDDIAAEDTPLDEIEQGGHLLDMMGSCLASRPKSIRSILQDSMMKIPYLHTSHPSRILAIQVDTLNFGRYGLQRVYQLVLKDKEEYGIASNQIKLHYSGAHPVKIMVVEFANEEKAAKFKTKYGMKEPKNFKQGLQQKQKTEEEKTASFNSRFQKSYILSEVDKKGEDYSSLFHIAFCKPADAMQKLMGSLFRYGEVHVQFPENYEIRETIKNISKLVVIHGMRGQEQLYRIYQNQQIHSPELSFLDHNSVSSESYFYRWRVYSYLQGDGDSQYSTRPFQMTTTGPVWYPPNEKLTQKYGSYTRILGWNERIYLCQTLLEPIKNCKYHIEQTMAFCIHNIKCAVEISVIIASRFVESCEQCDLSNSIADNKQLIALLHLVSDMLSNSPNFIYREIFSVILPELFVTYVPASQVNKILQIIALWEKRYILDEQICQTLHFILTNQSKIRQRMTDGHENQIKHSFLTTQHQRKIHSQILQTSHQQIQMLLEKYGMPAGDNISYEICCEIVAVLMSNSQLQSLAQAVAPEASLELDGEVLSDKDILKIKNKGCRVVTCEGMPVRILFGNQKQPSSSIDK